MAENDKNHPHPPHGIPYQYPGGPWPSVFPHHHEEDGRWPRTPMPCHNDTEHAVEVFPWEHCYDDRDPCMCITSGEVAKWDGVHDLVSANSGAWGGKYDDSWKNSAELWESASEIVHEHSGYWDSAWSRASGYDPHALDPIYQILSGTSAFLETYKGLEKIQTKTDAWIQGDGTAKNPLSLTTDADSRLRAIRELTTKLYNGRAIDDANQMWLSKDDLQEFEEWLKALDDLMFVVDPTMIDYKSIISKMHQQVASAASFLYPESGGGIFIQLNKIWAILKGMERWVVETTSATVEHWSDSADKWNWTWNAVNSSADYWNRAASSASILNSAYSIVNEHYHEWNATYNIINNNSSYWSETYNIVNNSSQYWNSAYTEITDIQNNSAGVWNGTYGLVKENSAYWGTQDTSWKNSAENWEAAYSAVAENSAYWSSGSHVTWKYEKDMNASNAGNYKEPNVIYFNEN